MNLRLYWLKPAVADWQMEGAAIGEDEMTQQMRGPDEAKAARGRSVASDGRTKKILTESGGDMSE